jgi:hypothetical protein
MELALEKDSFMHQSDVMARSASWGAKQVKHAFNQVAG